MVTVHSFTVHRAPRPESSASLAGYSLMRLQRSKKNAMFVAHLRSGLPLRVCVCPTLFDYDQNELESKERLVAQHSAQIKATVKQQADTHGRLQQWQQELEARGDRLDRREREVITREKNLDKYLSAFEK